MIDPNKESPVRQVLDRAKTKAFQRGAQKPGWDDIWLSMAEQPEFAKVLSERGVMTSSFARDLSYATKFGLKGDVIPGARTEKDAIKRVCDDVMEKLNAKFQQYHDQQRQSYRDEEEQENLTEEERQAQETKEEARFTALSDMMNMVREELYNLSGRNGEDKGDDYNEALQFVVSAVLSKLMEARGASMMGGAVEIDRHTLMQLVDVVNIPMFQNTSDRGMLILEQLDAAHPLQRPSALEVVDTLIMASPDYYKQLFYRNGLLTSDTSMEDELSDKFPQRFVQDVALQALEIAYGARSKQVDARHVAMALLGSSELQMHLHDLGVKDLLELRDGFVDRAFEAEQEDESTIRVHPEITPDFIALIQQLDVFAEANKKDEHLPSKMFRKIFKENEQIDTDLNKAGLRRRMSRGWAKPYKEDDEAKKGKDKDQLKDEKKKKEKPFEIADDELEALIAEYCVDYTKLAAQKKFDPMIGNADAMEQVETTLLKRGKKNPIVIGEPGIGKTKILEGFAQRIVSGKVPKKLIGSRLLSLDLHSINTSPYVGVFESRILPILKGVAERNASGRFPPVQLAIDEFANAMDAGAHSKGEGIKGMIKPYLTSGDLFVIGTTTMDEYQTKVQKDGALTRRFNPVMLTPPTEQEAAEILLQLKAKYARHHGIRIPNALTAKVANFAERFIHQVNHPDKSLDLLDLACAMAVQDGDKTLDEKHIARATSSMSGVPEEFLNKDDKQRYVDLPETLQEHVLDQDEAIGQVSAALQRAKAGLRSNPEAPIGTFLFVGPTGVGKTELTRALTRLLYGNEDYLIRFDMSEFQEKQSAARLIGSPAGYVGYEEGGRLIKEVQAKPYSVILYDEIEKAHPDVFNVLLRPFDSGMVTDGRGKSANMQNTINIMTSNLGAAAVMKRGQELGLDPLKDQEAWQRMAAPIYKQAVETFFKPEFLNRLDGVIYFNSLSEETIEFLVDRQVKQAQAQVEENHHGLKLDVGEAFRKAVAAKGFDIRFGARPLKRAWQDMVATPMAAWLLAQDDRKLKRADRLVVEATGSMLDPDAVIAEAIENVPEGEDPIERLREAEQRIANDQIIVPTFKLAK